MKPTLSRGLPPPPFYAQVRGWQLDQAAIFGRTRNRAFALLSNMTALPLQIAGQVVPSSESLYQAAKFPYNYELQQAVLHLPGHSAKALARKEAEQVVTDWDERRRIAMFTTLGWKLLQHPGVAECLQASQGRAIVELSRSDAFWGANELGEEARGTNMLGRMWMATRAMHFARSPRLYDAPAVRARGLWPTMFDV